VSLFDLSLNSAHEREYKILVFLWLIPVLSIFLQKTYCHFSLQLKNIPLCVCISYFLYSFRCWWTPKVKNGANMGLQVSLLHAALHSYGYMPRNSIAGSYGSSIFTFLRNIHTDFHRGYTLIYISTNSVSFFTNPCQNFWLFSSWLLF
jgi:hypothetical protein